MAAVAVGAVAVGIDAATVPVTPGVANNSFVCTFCTVGVIEARCGNVGVLN